MNHYRRRLRVASLAAAAAAVGIVIAVLIATSTTNAALNAREHATIEPYGEKVTIEHGDINVLRTFGAGPTLVLLSGYGTAAPGVDFAPLIRELKGFEVIVVEGFGYGYSDSDVTDRTVDNITAELHEVLLELGIDEPVVLVGHSVGGLYARSFANRYPESVSAIVGIDPMAAHRSSSQVGSPSVVEALQGASGLFRVVTALDPGLVQPTGTAFTREERQRIQAMANWNYGNPSVSDEWSRIGANSDAVAQRPFAADLPVLEILSRDNIASNPAWLPDHEAELAGLDTHELVTLPGSHYLHWTQAAAIARLITRFTDDLRR